MAQLCSYSLVTSRQAFGAVPLPKLTPTPALSPAFILQWFHQLYFLTCQLPWLCFLLFVFRLSKCIFPHPELHAYNLSASSCQFISNDTFASERQIEYQKEWPPCNLVKPIFLYNMITTILASCVYCLHPEGSPEIFAQCIPSVTALVITHRILRTSLRIDQEEIASSWIWSCALWHFK